MDALQRYRWRGNIRELRNAVERLLIMTPSDVVRLEDLPRDFQSGTADARSAAPVATGWTPPNDAPTQAAPAAASPGTSLPTAAAPPAAAGTLREFKDATERAYLVQRLRENGWNISKTAEVIDTPRSNLYKKLEQYAISQETDG